MHPSVGSTGERYVISQIQSCRHDLTSPRSESTISGPTMFCTSTPTRQARAKIVGTMDLYKISILSCIPIPVSPLFNLWTGSSASTIKVRDDLYKRFNERLNRYLIIDPKTDLIRVLHQRGTSTSWDERPDITKAVKGSSFAVVRCPDSDPNKIVSRIYYQDPDLYLRERYYDHLSTPAQWILGEQVPGLR